MDTIKSYTDLEQSKKLAEILPLESADMWYPLPCEEGDKPLLEQGGFGSTPCWSLTALLSVLEHPRCFQGDKPIYWFCGCFDKDKLYHEVEADNPVDACVKMILRLEDLKR